MDFCQDPIRHTSKNMATATTPWRDMMLCRLAAIWEVEAELRAVSVRPTFRMQGATRTTDMVLGERCGDTQPCNTTCSWCRFARSGVFSGVIAADFSESMLQQTREYCLAEGGSLNGR